MEKVVSEFKERCKKALCLNDVPSTPSTPHSSRVSGRGSNENTEDVWFNETQIDTHNKSQSLKEMGAEEVQDILEIQDTHGNATSNTNGTSTIRIFTARDNISNVLMTDIGLATVLHLNKGTVKIQKFSLVSLGESNRKKKRLAKMKESLLVSER